MNLDEKLELICSTSVLSSLPGGVWYVLMLNCCFSHFVYNLGQRSISFFRKALD